MIAELELKNETPVFLGSYDTQFHEDDPFRTQSLKGLWRYWVRAYIAGAMFEKGVLTCKKSDTRVCGVDSKSLDILLAKTQEILGGPKLASKFRIFIEDVSVSKKTIKKEEKEKKFKIDGEEKGLLEVPQRIRLLMMGKGDRSLSFANDVRTKVKVEVASHADASDLEIKIALGSLLTALTLNGLGKMGRRGFGTFSIRGDGHQFIRSYLDSRGFFIFEKLPDLINETLNAACSCIDEKGTPHELPPLDCVTRRKIDLSAISVEQGIFNRREVPVFSVIKVEKRSKADSLQLLSELQDFFYRPGRTRKMGIGITRAEKSEDLLTKERFSWFLGLPREQKETGYSAAVERRASPIHLAVHNGFGLFTLFLSGDWPLGICWERFRRRPHNIKVRERETIPLLIDENIIKRAYLTVLLCLEKYLKACGYSYEVMYP